MTLDPEFKGAVCSSLDEIVYLNQRNYKNFTFRVSTEYLKTSPVAFFFRKNSYLIEAFNEKLSVLKAAGLVDFWISKFMDIKYIKLKEAAASPRTMKLDQLKGVFIMWLIGCCVGLIAFIFEISSCAH